MTRNDILRAWSARDRCFSPRTTSHASLQDAYPSTHCVSLCQSLILWVTLGIVQQLKHDSPKTGRIFNQSQVASSPEVTYYHWIRDPIRNAQLPQNVASEASYSAPLLPYAGPKAPQSFSMSVTYFASLNHSLVYSL